MSESMSYYDEERYYKLDKYIDTKKIYEIQNNVNRELILKYDRQLKLERRAITTTSTNKQKLIFLFRRFIYKEWGTVTKEEMEYVVATIDNSNFSEKTKSNYKKMFKQFDRWFNNGKYSERTKWIKGAPIKRKLNTLKRNDLLTSDEKQKLIDSADNLRDKALISIWLETGMRPKELRVLTIGCITYDNDLMFIDIPNDTKTGARVVPIYYSKRALTDYLNIHPDKDAESSLWLRLNKKGYSINHPLTRNSFTRILHYVSSRAGITKRVYWYLGRHNSFTDKISSGWNEGIIKFFHGIEQGSSVLNRYVHLSQKDLIEKVKNYYGLKTQKNDFKEGVNSQKTIQFYLDLNCAIS